MASANSTEGYVHADSVKVIVRGPAGGDTVCAGAVTEAVEDYVAQQSGDLTFRAGDIIRILADGKDGWWLGRVEKLQAFLFQQHAKLEQEWRASEKWHQQQATERLHQLQAWMRTGEERLAEEKRAWERERRAREEALVKERQANEEELAKQRVCAEEERRARAENEAKERRAREEKLVEERRVWEEARRTQEEELEEQWRASIEQAERREQQTSELQKHAIMLQQEATTLQREAADNTKALQQQALQVLQEAATQQREAANTTIALQQQAIQLLQTATTLQQEAADNSKMLQQQALSVLQASTSLQQDTASLQREAAAQTKALQQLTIAMQQQNRERKEWRSTSDEWARQQMEMLAGIFQQFSSRFHSAMPSAGSTVAPAPLEVVVAPAIVEPIIRTTASRKTKKRKKSAVSAERVAVSTTLPTEVATKESEPTEQMEQSSIGEEEEAAVGLAPMTQDATHVNELAGSGHLCEKEVREDRETPGVGGSSSINASQIPPNDNSYTYTISALDLVPATEELIWQVNDGVWGPPSPSADGLFFGSSNTGPGRNGSGVAEPQVDVVLVPALLSDTTSNGYGPCTDENFLVKRPVHEPWYVATVCPSGVDTGLQCADENFETERPAPEPPPNALGYTSLDVGHKRPARKPPSSGVGNQALLQSEDPPPKPPDPGVSLQEWESTEPPDPPPDISKCSGGGELLLPYFASGGGRGRPDRAPPDFGVGSQVTFQGGVPCLAPLPKPPDPGVPDLGSPEPHGPPDPGERDGLGKPHLKPPDGEASCDVSGPKHLWPLDTFRSRGVSPRPPDPGFGKDTPEMPLSKRGVAFPSDPGILELDALDFPRPPDCKGTVAGERSEVKSPGSGDPEIGTPWDRGKPGSPGQPTGAASKPPELNFGGPLVPQRNGHQAPGKPPFGEERLCSL